MQRPITIRQVGNGFIVLADPKQYEVSDDSTTNVFESFKSLAEHLEKYFNPLLTGTGEDRP